MYLCCFKRLFNMPLLEVVRAGGDLVAAAVPDDRRRRGDGDGQARAGDGDRDRLLRRGDCPLHVPSKRAFSKGLSPPN